ncbi:hypothetical protein LX36DRAFT_582788 [Colletotrichum falcatum]|nr:hypothetical protein LX36DRAFT_582788 [Colletotrichum falcatum]
MDASSRRLSSAAPPLTQTLDVLNALDPGADVEALWAQLRQAFSREQPSDDPAAFSIFAFAQVRRPILEIATEQQYRNDLSHISNDQKRRLRSIAKQLNISPAIFCLLFTPKCAASRTCTNIDARIWQQQPPSTAKRHVKIFRTRPAKVFVSDLSDISEEHSRFPPSPEARQTTPADNEDRDVSSASDEDKENIMRCDDGDATWGDGEYIDVETDKETFVCHVIKLTR